MRLRLFSKLFILIAATAMAAALAMAGVLSINLGRGFAHYLESRDSEQLDELVASIAARMEQQGGVAALRDGRLTGGELLRDLIATDRFPKAKPPLPPMMAAKPPPPPASYSQLHDRGPPGTRNRTPPEDFASRLQLYDASGNQVAGPSPPRAGGPAILKRVVRVGGETVATVGLLPRGRIPDGVDARFLRSQYQSAAILTLVLLLLAAVPALLLARRGTARLTDMNRVTAAIAKGNFSARIAVIDSDEVSAMGHNINTMADSLAQLDGARRRWLAEISHELRTPLTALIGELDALKDGLRMPDAAAIQSLAEEAQRMSRIVQDLHFLAVSDLSGSSCQFAPTDAVLVVSRVVARFAAAARAANLTITLDAGDQKSLLVVWDGERIDQMLANLLSNSIRYTNGPGRVRVRIERQERSVRIGVDDSAPCVPPEHLQRLFEPLFREDAARSRVSGGSGLGLAVCRAIAVTHGGRIAAAASELGGLSIQVDLPLDGNRA